MPLTINLEKLTDQKYRDLSVPFPVDGTPAGQAAVSTDALWDSKGDLAVGTGPDTAQKLAVGTNGQVLTADSTQPTGIKWAAAAGGGVVATDAIWDTKGDLAVATGADTASKLAAGTNGQVLTADSSQATGLKWATPAAAATTPFVLSYDTTGVAGASSALQAAIDAGYRNIVIPAGVFKCDAAVFDDLTTNEANATLHISAYGVRFEATTSLPTVTEFDGLCSGVYGTATGCKFFLFPNTSRTALSAGVVTATNNFVTPTYQTRVPVNPRLVMSGGAFSAVNLTKYNAGFIYGNRGGAVKIENCHLSSARTLLSWTDYVDGNSMYSCSGWGAVVMDASYDSWLWWGGGSGDAVVIDNCKVDNLIGIAKMLAANGANIRGTIAGMFDFRNCHGVHIDMTHIEQGASITTFNKAYYIQDSRVTITTALDYSSDNVSTSGLVYIDDSGLEGTSSQVELHNYQVRDWITENDSAAGYAIYINKMANATRIRCRGCTQSISTSGTFYYTWGQGALKISGNAATESTLAAALVQGRDLIASGDFDIVKYTTSTVAQGQDSAIPIVVRQIGNLAGLRVTRSHGIPTFYDTETSSNGSGTLSNGTAYGYCAALCNTLPDSTIQYGQATSGSWDITVGASGVAGFELYCPTAAHGATLVIWRKTGAGVQATPDHYIAIPVQAATTRFIDQGAHINKYTWLTTSIPVPSSVAASNHTGDGIYLGTTAITVP